MILTVISFNTILACGRERLRTRSMRCAGIQAMVTIDKVQGVLHNNIVTFLYYTSINQIEFKYSMILHCAAKKLHHYYFCNKFVKPHNIFIIFFTQILR